VKYPYFYYTISIIGLTIAHFLVCISFEYQIHSLLIISRVCFAIFDSIHIYHHIVFISRIYDEKNFCFAISFYFAVDALVSVLISLILSLLGKFNLLILSLLGKFNLLIF
jgi:hypothetical protein